MEIGSLSVLVIFIFFISYENQSCLISLFRKLKCCKRTDVFIFFWSYEVFGKKRRLRSAEDIAFHVALFIAKKGSFVNYYMVCSSFSWPLYSIISIHDFSCGWSKIYGMNAQVVPEWWSLEYEVFVMFIRFILLLKHMKMLFTYLNPTYVFFLKSCYYSSIMEEPILEEQALHLYGQDIMITHPLMSTVSSTFNIKHIFTLSKPKLNLLNGWFRFA